jgi:hypothetical protein
LRTAWIPRSDAGSRVAFSPIDAAPPPELFSLPSSHGFYVRRHGREDDQPELAPPRRELFTQPSAVAVWAGICALEIGLQWEVLRELQHRLSAPDLLPDARVARCVLALKEAADALGRSPGEYEEVLTGAHRPAGWPSSHTVRHVLAGTWNDCLSRAALDAGLDGDVIVRELGSSFTEDEVIAALRACRNDLQRVPSLTEFIGWSCRPEVKRRPGRRPSSQGPFDRLFGGYLSALGAAGLADLDSGTWNGPRSTLAQGGVYRQTEAAMLDALREVAERVEHSPTTTEYTREREVIQKESIDAGRLRTIPSYQSILRRFGSWDGACVEAGLEPARGRQRERERPRGHVSPRRITDETIRAAIRDAYDELGDPFTCDAYKAWQKRKVAEDTTVARLKSRYPSYQTIWSRHGSWQAAVADALASMDGRDAHPDTTDDMPEGEAA